MNDLTRAVRQAAEAALLVYAGTGLHLGPQNVDSAVLRVYGDRLAVGGNAAAGQVIAELVVAHALALVRLAEATQRPLEQVAADLVSLMEGHA